MAKCLNICSDIKIDSISDANVKIQNITLINLYYKAFLNEVKKIVHKGLVRKYSFKSENRAFLKGRILFNRHIADNYLHKEKFFTSTQVYDHNNIFNQILLSALTTLKKADKSGIYKHEVNKLLLHFENVSCIDIEDKLLNSITYSRSLSGYKRGLDLAKMILLNYSPDVKTGMNSAIGILFDMNKLFERVVYRILKKQESKFTCHKLKITNQKSMGFWGKSTIRPDIVGEYKSNGRGKIKRFIIDTKWKIPKTGKPEASDLKQMYAYNLHFGSNHSILLYPEFRGLNSVRKKFYESVGVNNNYKNHCCQTYFIKLFDDNGKVLDDDVYNLLHEIINSK